MSKEQTSPSSFFTSIIISGIILLIFCIGYSIGNMVEKNAQDSILYELIDEVNSMGAYICDQHNMTMTWRSSTDVQCVEEKKRKVIDLSLIYN